MPGNLSSRINRINSIDTKNNMQLNIVNSKCSMTWKIILRSSVENWF